ncbi:recombinase family protein [Pararhodobacter oceanensis]|nr:recombinase family protein [Pararhodobacter oceanensis]
MSTLTKAVGYIRVSTEKQNDGDHALERQAEEIRKWCATRRISLLAIFDDTSSATHDLSAERRPGLRDALASATRENACLIVPEPTRLFRNAAAAGNWLDKHSVPVGSVYHDAVLDRQQILTAVESGEAFAQATRDGTAKALAEKRNSGVKLGSKTDRSAANAASAKARAIKSDNLVDEIASILLQNPAYRGLNNEGLAAILNSRGILTGANNPWTRDTIKRHRVRAKKRLLEWETDVEDDDVSVVELPKQTVTSEPAPSPIATSPQTHAPTPDTTPVVEQEDDEDAEMKKNPFFGMF